MDAFLNEGARLLAPSWDWIVAVATSWWALRIYALAAGAAVIVGSFWIANAQREEVEALDARKEKVFRGPKPKLIKSIERRIRELRGDSAEVLRRLLGHAGIVVLFGFLIPSLVVGLALHFYDWFRPGAEALVLWRGCAPIVNDATPVDTARFVGSQLAMGLGDVQLASEVVGGFDLGAPTYQPADGVVRLGIGAYRYFIGGFAALLFTVLRAAWRAWTHRSDSLRALEEQLKNHTRGA